MSVERTPEATVGEMTARLLDNEHRLVGAAASASVERL